MAKEHRSNYQVYQPTSFDESAPAGRAGPPATPETAEGGRFVPEVEPRDEEEVAGAAYQDTPFEGAGVGETDFAALKFARENTLLTNVEHYASSIREEAELYVRQLQAEVESLNQQADHRYEEARKIKEEAEAEAKRSVAAAVASVEEIQEQARREGLKNGLQAGTEQGYREAQPLLENLEAILEEFSRFRKQVDFYAEKDAVRIAILMAKKILQAELKINRKVVWTLLAKTLSNFAGQGNFRIWLSPEDFRFVTAARPALEKFLDDDQSVTFRSKADLPAGNAQIETDREIIDLTFASQFQHLESVLNQALAERETLAAPPPSAKPPPSARREPPVSAPAPEGEPQPTGETDAPAPEAPSATGPEAPSSTEPVEGSAETPAPAADIQAAAPGPTAPEAPKVTAPEAPGATAPEAPSASAPEAPKATAPPPEAPSATAPESDPDHE